MRTRTTLLLAFISLLLGCRVHPTDTASSPPETLRVLTYNVHHCEGVDKKLDVARIAAVINSSHADLVALQEIDVNTKRVPLDTPAELAKLTGLHVAFGKAIDFQGGAYGQLLLSRWPLEHVRVDKLPNTGDREQRIALSAHTHGLLFISTHLDHQINALREKQADELLRLFSHPANPNDDCILAGDMNATPTSAPMKKLHEAFIPTDDETTPTIPAEAPRSRIDYVLVRQPAGLRATDSRVLNEPTASDHRPVFVEMARFRPEK
jgi:endonuclease/exonuclease/phosphatase family metal-dependent hydrolase